MWPRESQKIHGGQKASYFIFAYFEPHQTMLSGRMSVWNPWFIKKHLRIQIEETPENKEELIKLKETLILSDKAKKFMIAQKLLSSSNFFDYFTNVG